MTKEIITFETGENIPPAVMQSAALTFQNYTGKRETYYPKDWAGKVPLKIRLKTDVRSDIPFDPMGAMANEEHYCQVNSHGAVSIVFPDGTLLGIKPAEFEVIEWHNVIK